MRTWTLVVSVCVHAAVVAAIFVAPLFAAAELPDPRRPLTFETIVPIEVPTVPTPPRPQAIQPSPTTPSFPVTEPPSIAEEIPSVADVPADVVAPEGIGVPAVGWGPLGDVISAPPQPPVRKDPLPVGGVIRPPARTVYVSPVYPPIAIAARKEGVVILQAVIDEKGSVIDVKVLRSEPLLDQAALQAVSQWQFTPTLLNGTPVPIVMTVTVGFTLKK